jgi:hypothetical protein
MEIRPPDDRLLELAYKWIAAYFSGEGSLLVEPGLSQLTPNLLSGQAVFRRYARSPCCCLH